MRYRQGCGLECLSSAAAFRRAAVQRRSISFRMDPSLDVSLDRSSSEPLSAQTDESGHRTLMSCQHAMPLGRIAGNNAMADLLGVPATAYAQPRYVTCLDLGPWGAVLTHGWQREVKLAGAEAKALKRQINRQWIYPPLAHRGTAFAMAEPGFRPTSA